MSAFSSFTPIHPAGLLAHLRSLVNWVRIMVAWALTRKQSVSVRASVVVLRSVGCQSGCQKPAWNR
jgi:hypothetical protein